MLRPPGINILVNTYEFTDGRMETVSESFKWIGLCLMEVLTRGEEKRSGGDEYFKGALQRVNKTGRFENVDEWDTVQLTFNINSWRVLNLYRSSNKTLVILYFSKIISLPFEKK